MFPLPGRRGLLSHTSSEDAPSETLDPDLEESRSKRTFIEGLFEHSHFPPVPGMWNVIFVYRIEV